MRSAQQTDWLQTALSIEICFPNESYARSPEIMVEEIDSSSFATTMTLLLGETETHQPVFRTNFDFFERDRAGIVKWEAPSGEASYYVFTFPLDTSPVKDQWSSWQQPAYRASSDPSLPLLYNRDSVAGKSVEKLALEATSPKLRFMLQDFGIIGQWIVDRRLHGQVHDIIPCE